MLGSILALCLSVVLASPQQSGSLEAVDVSQELGEIKDKLKSTKHQAEMERDAASAGAHLKRKEDLMTKQLAPIKTQPNALRLLTPEEKQELEQSGKSIAADPAAVCSPLLHYVERQSALGAAGLFTDKQLLDLVKSDLGSEFVANVKAVLKTMRIGAADKKSESEPQDDDITLGEGRDSDYSVTRYDDGFPTDLINRRTGFAADEASQLELQSAAGVARENALLSATAEEQKADWLEKKQIKNAQMANAAQSAEGKQELCEMVMTDLTQQMHNGATMLLSDVGFLKEATRMLSSSDQHLIKHSLEKLSRKDMILPFGEEPGQPDSSEPVRTDGEKYLNQLYADKFAASMVEELDFKREDAQALAEVLVRSQIRSIEQLNDAPEDVWAKVPTALKGALKKAIGKK